MGDDFLPFSADPPFGVQQPYNRGRGRGGGQRFHSLHHPNSAWPHNPQNRGGGRGGFHPEQHGNSGYKRSYPPSTSFDNDGAGFSSYNKRAYEPPANRADEAAMGSGNNTRDYQPSTSFYEDTAGASNFNTRAYGQQPSKFGQGPVYNQQHQQPHHRGGGHHQHGSGGGWRGRGGRGGGFRGGRNFGGVGYRGRGGHQSNRTYNISDYIHPSMLEDPWKELELQAEQRNVAQKTEQNMVNPTAVVEEPEAIEVTHQDTLPDSTYDDNNSTSEAILSESSTVVRDPEAIAAMITDSNDPANLADPDPASEINDTDPTDDAI